MIGKNGFARTLLNGAAVVSMALFLAGCLSSGSGSDVEPTKDDEPTPTNQTTYEGYGARATATVSTDANGDATSVDNVANDGPRSLSVTTTVDASNGDLKQLDADYGPGVKTRSFQDNCTTTATTGSCENSSEGETIEFGNLNFSADQGYQYLSVGEWDKDVPKNATSAPADIIVGVVGEKTPAASMPTVGTATYAGHANIFAARNGSGDTSVEVTGKATYNADFDNGTITGAFDNFKEGSYGDYASSSANAVPGHIDMNARISGGDITDGALSGNLNGLNVTGSAKGAFFGSNAQELGGALTIEDTDGQGYKGAGTFVGKRQ